MSREKIGKVALTPKGEYKSGTQYEPLDVITHSGKAYVVLSKVKGVTPSSDGENYQVLVSDGYTPKRGTDYWTDEDVVNVVRDVSEQSKAIVDKEAEAKKNSVLGSIPDDYTALSRKVNNASNALKGTASGEAVGLHDVSPIEHRMDVRVRSKNIAITTSFNDVPAGNASGTVIGIMLPTLKKGKTYTLSFDTENTGALMQFLTYNRPVTMVTSSDITSDGTRKSVTFTMTDDFPATNYNVTWIQLRSTSTTNSGLCSNVQWEEGTTATPYTPYVPDVSSVSVSVYGENLFNPALVVDRTQTGITTQVQADGGILFSGTATGAARMAVPDKFTTPIHFPPGTYAISGNHVEFIFAKADGSTSWIKGVFTLTEPVTLTNIAFNKLKVGSEYNEIIYPSLVVGNVPKQATYIEPVVYTPNADGTVDGVTSVYPSTTLLTDTEGVVIDCEYNRDINKAFAELQQAIISLGGNV